MALNITYHDYVRGATALLRQVETKVATATSAYAKDLQLTHMPRGNHAQSIASNGGQREDKKSLQRSQLRQNGEFQHVSVSE